MEKLLFCFVFYYTILPKETEPTDLCRQLDGLKVESSYLDGFLSHLQNEVKEKLIKEETDLHIYSSNDVDMLVPNPGFSDVHWFYFTFSKSV